MVPKIWFIYDRWLLSLLITALFFTSCTANPKKITPNALAQPATLPPTSSGHLTPYTAPSATASLTTTIAVSPTPLPSATPTPRTHMVKKGEDMGGIAWQYRVSLQELMAANPTVKPNLMSVGTLLVIPQSSTPMPQALDASAPPPSLTPIPVDAGPLNCAQAADGGLWCFQPVRNQQSATLEGITAVIRLAGSQPGPMLEQKAFLPLDTLAPGATLPLSAYFPPDQVAASVPPYQYSSQVLTVLPGADDGRYIKTRVEDQKVVMAEDGLSASVSANVLLDSGSAKARRVWVAAVAWDGQGNVVGVRRWEMLPGSVLESGQALPVQVNIYSSGGKILKVDLTSEARP